MDLNFLNSKDEDIQEAQQLSPVPDKPQVLLNFPDAMREVIAGKKITRIEWGNDNSYGVLKDGFLSIHLIDTFHQWIVSDGDMNATDWKII